MRSISPSGLLERSELWRSVGAQILFLLVCQVSLGEGIERRVVPVSVFMVSVTQVMESLRLLGSILFFVSRMPHFSYSSSVTFRYSILKVTPEIGKLPIAVQYSWP
jgi:hypothetical protein